MENQIKNKRKKLVISFAGCTKRDKVDKNNSEKSDSNNRSFNPRQINNCGVYQAEHISSQLFYKFE
ncbi:hypothetical protein [Candidatus Cardinium hertigii]|uniref:hypothetical protein n=1 Tax=Candidatus Cardinium hertigii TaxID=247481 RepID=UPI000D708CFE|nr:hypothetical protein [Candidatus Cardinium hertigii]